jgi:hypothetical protein
MSKAKWYKLAYLFIALTLALSFSLVPVQVAASTGVNVTASPSTGFSDPPLEVDIEVEVLNAVGDVDYEFTWQYKQNEGDVYLDLNAMNFPLLFSDDINRLVENEDDNIMESWTLDVPGLYEVTVEATDNLGTRSDTTELRVLGIVPIGIIFDVKGAQQKICVKGLLDQDPPNGIYDIEWELWAGEELDPGDIKIKDPSPEESPPCFDSNDPETWPLVDWDPSVVAGFPCIHIRSMKSGDIHVFATVMNDPLAEDPYENIILHTEKNWGELDHSVLDLDANEEGIQGPTEYVTVDSLEMGLIEETIEDTVYATYEQVVDPWPAGHAVVHWWLFEDSEENQALIDELMEHLASQGGGFDDPLDQWAVHGQYDTEWIGDWMEELGYVGPMDIQPFDALDFLARDVADGGLGLHADEDIFWWAESGDWYYQNRTSDSWPAEEIGKTQATLVVDAAELEGCQTEEVMIVVLVQGIIPDDVAYDVVGAQQEICVKGVEGPEEYNIEWWLESGIDLEPGDIIVKIPPGLDVNGTTPGNPEDPSTWDKIGWLEEFEDTGLTGRDLTKGFSCIHIEALAEGGIHVFARVSRDPCGEGDDVTYHIEKKWGELDHSVLDLDADEEGIQGPIEYVTVDPLEMGEIEEVIEDTVYATFEEVIGDKKVGHAIVHWWLFEDADLADLLAEAEDANDEDLIEILENLIDEGYTNTQELIDELMDYIASQGGALDDNHWAAHGKYLTDDITDWMEGLGYTGPSDREPFDAIDFLAKDIGDGGLELHAHTDIFRWGECDDWYYQNETADSWSAEDRGKAQATLVVDAAELEECIQENVMIVVLVSYPGSGDPTDDPFNGELIVVIEKGKKQFHKTSVNGVSVDDGHSVSYPDSKNLKEDLMNGYNMVIIEKGKKKFHKEPCCDEETELSFDNDQLYTGWLCGGQYCGGIVLFNPPTSPWILSKAKVMAWIDLGDAPFWIEVWDSDFNELFHGEYMYSDYFTSSPAWVEIELPCIDVQGEFYLGFFGNWSESHKLWLGYDNDSISHRSFVADCDDNTVAYENEWNWMIRAGGCSPPTAAIGGEVYPANKVGLVAPWVALAVVIASGGAYLVRRRVQSHK